MTDQAERHEVGHDAIARRAYEISQTDEAGTPEENWQRAERELRGAGAEPSSEPWAKTSSGDADSITTD